MMIYITIIKMFPLYVHKTAVYLNVQGVSHADFIETLGLNENLKILGMYPYTV